MCGILGTLPPVQVLLFKKALDTITHRGPDDFGTEVIGNDITLGHRRLSIVDLTEQGHQPMFSLDNRYCIAFNGEIYNFLEIRRELEKLGYRFKSHSDTEVLLNSYIEWGSNCVLKFNGMWAFAIWDKQEKELFFSRDRFGKKPLFYAYIKDQFVFASEMKAIYPFLGEVKPSKDFQWMKNNIFLYEGSEKCLIEGIKRFPAGHNGTYKSGKLKLVRYWNTLDNLVSVPQHYGEQVEQFRELFLDACKIRMRSDVPIGTALSGGLDSSATISAMSHIANTEKGYGDKDWQHAFVASFPGTPLDETYYAKKVAEYIDIKATYLDINPLAEWEHIYEHLYQFEELYITSPVPMLMTYRAVKSAGVSVTIDGHGADELFSGYGHLLEALWDAGANYSLVKDILQTLSETRSDFSQRKKDNDIAIYSKYIIKKAIKKMIGREYQSRDFNHSKFSNLDHFSQQLYIIFHETILPTLLRNYDRYSMMNSVEIRMPFMDHRIVSYVNSLPYTSKFGKGYTKLLIRDAIDPYMPKEVTWRKSKIGFNSPIVDWMQNDLREWFGDIIYSKDFIESSVIDDYQNIQTRIERILNKKDNLFSSAEKAWTDLTPFLWEKAVIKRNY